MRLNIIRSITLVVGLQVDKLHAPPPMLVREIVIKFWNKVSKLLQKFSLSSYRVEGRNFWKGGSIPTGERNFFSQNDQKLKSTNFY